MEVPVWSVVTWTPVLVSVSEFNRSLCRFSQLTLAKLHGHAETGADYGQVLWATTVDKRLVGLAWDWAALCKGAVAMTDPMNVLSNVVLHERDGRILPDEQRMVYLSTAVHTLPWQSHVLSRDRQLQLQDGRRSSPNPATPFALAA